MFKPFSIAIVSLAVILMTGCGDDDSKPEKSGATTTVTPAEGGSLESPDNNISVQIPADAVGEEVEIEVTESANNLDNGIGKIYSLTEQEFSKPVVLTLKYSDEEVSDNDTYPELLRLMTRNSKDDDWEIVEGFTLDKINHELKANVTHFSDWTLISVEGTMSVLIDQSPLGSLDLGVIHSDFIGGPFKFRALNDDFFFRAQVDSTIMQTNYDTYSVYLDKISVASDTLDVLYLQPTPGTCYYRYDGSNRLRFTNFSRTSGELVTGNFTVVGRLPEDNSACQTEKVITATFAYRVR